MSTVANRFRTFCQTTSAHGFPQLANTEQLVSKIFWSLVLLFFSGLLLYNTGNVVATYFDEGSRWGTSISERYSSELAHPTVTICNYNSFRKSVVEKTETPKNLLVYLLLENRSSHYFYSSEKSEIMAKVEADWKKWRSAFNVSNDSMISTASEIKKKSCHQCEELIKMMRVTSQSTGTQQTVANPCALTMENDSIQAYVVRPLDIKHDCTQLRFSQENPKLNMVTMGQAKGTTLLLDVEPDEYMDIADANPPDVGLMVQLTVGERIEYGNWINLSPGYHYWVGMRRVERRTGEAFDSFFKAPCVKKPTLRFMYAKFYSKELCYYDCGLIPFVQMCNCHRVETPKYRKCEQDEYTICSSRLEKTPVSKEQQTEIDKCIESCEAPCEDETITSSITFSRFPSPAQLPALQESLPEIFANMSLEEIKNRYIMLDVYYASGYITVIEWRLRTPLGSLFSNLGGLMGLFLGISVITLINAVLYFCLDPIKQIWNKRNTPVANGQDHNE